jgi:transcriptional regulator with XRE-family HTH domain
MIAQEYVHPRDVATRNADAKIGPHRRSALWVQALVSHYEESQEKFAERVGMSRGGIAKLYYGQQRPRGDSLEKLTRVAPDHLKHFATWRPTEDGASGRTSPPLPSNEHSNTEVLSEPETRGFRVTSPFERNLIAMVRGLPVEFRQELLDKVSEFVLARTTGSRPPDEAGPSDEAAPVRP